MPSSPDMRPLSDRDVCALYGDSAKNSKALAFAAEGEILRRGLVKAGEWNAVESGRDAIKIGSPECAALATWGTPLSVATNQVSGTEVDIMRWPNKSATFQNGRVTLLQSN
jgi:hypothetical protein